MPLPLPTLPDASRAPSAPARPLRGCLLRAAGLALAFLACSAIAPAAVLWSETFDDLTYLDGMSSEPCGDKLSGCDCGDDTSLKITTTHKRAGSAALQARLTKCHERAELRAKTYNQPAVGATRYYGFSLRPDANFDQQRWTIVAQWAQWYSSVPNWANEGAWNFLGIENGRWSFRAKWSDGSAQNVKISSTDLGPVVRGSFTDFIVMGNWRAISGGELQVWVRQPGATSYTKKFYRAGSVMLDVPKAPYFKVGLYRGDPNWSSPNSVDYLTIDEVRVGTAYNDVAIGAGGSAAFPNPSAWYNLRNTAHGTRHLRAGNSGEGWNVNTSTGAAAWERWRFVDAGGGFYYVRNYSHGGNRNLQAKDGAGAWNVVTSTNAGSWEKWRLVPVSGGNNNIRNSDHGGGRNLRAFSSAGSFNVDTGLNSGTWESWSIIQN